MQTALKGRHAGAIDWLVNPVLKNDLGLGYLENATQTKQQRKGYGEEVTKFVQRSFS
jgi:hypothetical protein